LKLHLITNRTRPMSHLFSRLTIKDIVFKNRIAVSPMCQYSSVENGCANDWHLVHLGGRAVGGAALVIQEATAISAEARITPRDLGIYLDDHIEKLRQITDFIHAQGSVAGIQLAHAGRKASHLAPWEGSRQLLSTEPGGWKTKSSGSLPFSAGEEPPAAASRDDIRQIINDFSAAASRALGAGYRVLEIHAAHGYLINQFLSPLVNTRTDEYGGSFKNRIRLLLEIIDAIQKVWPDRLPLFIRISSSDWMEGGWDMDQSVQLAAILKENGVDLVDCSSGGAVPEARIRTGPGYQVPFAERIKKETGILTGAVGLITGPEQAEQILEQGQADLILLAREFLRDPYFPLHAAQTLGENIPWPDQYLRAKPTR
jgi:2,4-dienoyl-CoA reductase-like NADH-dependent reductase (Old Yellow Enzyme family)